MANNYVEFSEAIEDITEEEEIWIKKELGTKKAKDDYLNDFIKIDETGTLRFSCIGDNYGEPVDVVDFAQKFLKKFRPEHGFYLCWAYTCSKPWRGEFGGAAAVVTAKSMRWLDTREWAEQTLAEVLIDEHWSKED